MMGGERLNDVRDFDAGMVGVNQYSMNLSSKSYAIWDF